MHDSTLGHMQVGEMSVRILHVELDCTRSFCEAATHFCNGVFETVRQIDAGTKGLFGHGIQYGFAAAFYDAIDFDVRGSAFNIHRELERREYGIVHLVERRREDLKDCGAGLSVLTAQYPQQRIPLRIGCADVDDWNELSLTLMDGPGPVKNGSHVQAVKCRSSMMAALNLNHGNRFTMSMRGQRIELTRTPVGAIAVQELASFDFPFAQVVLLPIPTKCYRTAPIR